MSDDAKIERVAQQDEPQDEVEAHNKHTKLAANDEPAQEGDDEVEAHRHGVRTAEPDNRFA
jgi:hypothetical protein